MTGFAEDWPSPHIIDILCRKAAGFFIYASTAVKFVSSHFHPPDEILDLIVSLLQEISHEGRLDIDLLYTQILEQAFHNLHDHRSCSHLKSVVGTVVLIFCPLPINTISDLLGDSPSKISSFLQTLHLIFLVPDSTEDPIWVFHKSFSDFLTDPGQCTDYQFFI